MLKHVFASFTYPLIKKIEHIRMQIIYIYREKPVQSQKDNVERYFAEFEQVFVYWKAFKIRVDNIFHISMIISTGTMSTILQLQLCTKETNH